MKNYNHTVHIGMAMLAIKALCDTHPLCENCPLTSFCMRDGWSRNPCTWEAEHFPNVNVELQLTEPPES